MNNNIGPTDNELINYLSWCEACDITPFGEEKQEEENKEENNEEVDYIKILKRKRKDD